MLTKVSPSLEIKQIQTTASKVSIKFAMVFGLIPTILLILTHFQA